MMEVVSKSRVKALAASGEGEYIEYKRRVDDPSKIVKELIAFANTKGGTLLIGVSDEGRIPGLQHPEGDWFILEKALNRYCRPMISYALEIVEINARSAVILLNVHESNKKPHYYQIEKGSPKEVYLRYRDECVKASREQTELMQMKRRRILIKYGDEERELLQYLASNSKITVAEFKIMLNISKRKASAILVKLAVAEVLELVPCYGKEDYFILK